MLKMFLHWIRFHYWNSSNERKRKFLISRGAKIGEGTRILSTTACFSTEPYLISVGKDVLISLNVLLFPHDGGVKVLNDYGRCVGGARHTLINRMIRWDASKWATMSLLVRAQ